MFDVGGFTSGLLTGLREGVEAALIVSIICAYLSRTGNGRHLGRIGVGVTAAVAASAGLGLLVFATLGELQTTWEQIFEGTTLLVAASACARRTASPPTWPACRPAPIWALAAATRSRSPPSSPAKPCSTSAAERALTACSRRASSTAPAA